MLLPNKDAHIITLQGVGRETEGIGGIENKGRGPMEQNNTLSSTSEFDLANMISNQ